MNCRGFTFIELAIILLLVGIIALFVAPKLGDMPGTKAGAFVDKLRSDIRYAQNLAMTRNQRYRVYINTPPAPGSGYAVVNDANSNGTWGEAGEFALDPAAGGSLSITLNAGTYAGITVSTPPGGYVEFNSLGASTAAADVTITVNGDAALSVTITAKTGMVN